MPDGASSLDWDTGADLALLRDARLMTAVKKCMCSIAVVVQFNSREREEMCAQVVIID